MENPFVKLVREEEPSVGGSTGEDGEQGLTEDLERQLGEARAKLEEAEKDETREELKREIEDIERTIREISET